MTSPAPLTEAERIAAEVLRTECITEGVITTADPESFDRTVRAVVAAVEPLHTIAALESAATALDKLAAANALAGRGTAEGPWIAAGVQGAALNVRRQARELRQSLSLPASKETPDAR